MAALRAGAEYANVPVDDCVLVSGSLSGVAGAERIGMPCVVVRSRLIFQNLKYQILNAIKILFVF